ncbi:DUF3127 domain-containing protein [Myroides sp. LoEW2-1]|uniref:DUF3127 domain-containing protein n=1 Tax=Myroides sp. LoEW2-1 TaxID=2683192 RepID=UPI001328CFCC|nr:DUF3127 domain-containing protein [Myroides sp. LoEW2-1]MVX37249.1 DUF3127 domain-containing protein [Myroides sp. LoEW2-1]
MNIEGTIKLVGNTQDISATFKKREFVITTNEQYPQHILVEFIQDKVSLLDNFRPGDIVKVDINLKGREWISPQGETRYFNTIQGWRIIKAVNQDQVQYQDQQGYMQGGQYHGQGSAVNAYQQQGNFQQNQQQGFNQGNQSNWATTENQDDLPF